MRGTNWRKFAVITALTLTAQAHAAEPTVDDLYHHAGELVGSLRTQRPAIYDPDPDHLWNRLFAAFYVRESNLPGTPDGAPVRRNEGGDTIDFLGWSGTTYWSEAATTERLNAVLDEFLAADGGSQIDDPLKRALLLRDLWAAFDFLIGQNIERFGSPDDIHRRDEVCRRLALVIRSLALTFKTEDETYRRLVEY